mgnify:CR=1 FL=1|jgi:type IV secretion system protein VirB5
MKRKLIILSLSGVLSSPVIASGIPVIDVASLTQQITQVGHMVNQLQEMKRQLETAESQLSNISGSRGLASAINTTYDTAVDISESDILTSNNISNAEQVGVNPAFRNIYNEANSNAAQNLGRSQKTLTQAKERYNRLMPLITKINNSPDQKDILDLQARIQGEQVMLQNELIKLEAMKAEAAAKDEIHQRKIAEIRTSSIGSVDRDMSNAFD